LSAGGPRGGPAPSDAAGPRAGRLPSDGCRRWLPAPCGAGCSHPHHPCGRSVVCGWPRGGRASSAAAGPCADCLRSAVPGPGGHPLRPSVVGGCRSVRGSPTVGGHRLRLGGCWLRRSSVRAVTGRCGPSRSPQQAAAVAPGSESRRRRGECVPPGPPGARTLPAVAPGPESRRRRVRPTRATRRQHSSRTGGAGGQDPAPQGAGTNLAGEAPGGGTALGWAT
jgi:hypothetical protein